MEMSRHECRHDTEVVGIHKAQNNIRLLLQFLAYGSKLLRFTVLRARDPVGTPTYARIAAAR